MQAVRRQEVALGNSGVVCSARGLARRRHRCRCSAAAPGPDRAAGDCRQLPDVDWSRYHLQVLFIDGDDVLRGRMAAALLERVAEWNGYGRVILPFSCGVDADQGAPAGDISTQAALMWKARALGLRAKAFTRPTERFEAADLDRHDVLVAVDRATKDAVLRLVDPRYQEYYDAQVRLLSEYGSDDLLQDAQLLRKGGLALLPRAYASALSTPRLPLRELRQRIDVPRPNLTDASPGAAAEFDDMVSALMLCTAGLVSYLIDSYPPDLPEYDPL